VVFPVVNNYTFIGVKTNHEFARTATAGFFDAPDAAIDWKTVIRFGMPQIPDFADVIGNGGGASGFSQLVGMVQNQEGTAIGVGYVP
jgi:hypothetical protein